MAHDKLDKQVETKLHEGVSMMVARREYSDLKKFTDFEKLLRKKENNVVVFIHKVSDSSSYATLIRTAYFLGADFIIVGKDERHTLDGSIAKISGGTSEATELYCVKFVSQFLLGN